MYRGFKLELPPVDVDDDGAAETGIFEFTSNVSVTPQIRTGFLLGGAGSSINSVLSGLYEEATGEQLQGDGKRQGFYLDLGAGEHAFEVRVDQYAPGDTDQWGATADTGVQDGTSATGGDAYRQAFVFDRYVTLSTPDSVTPATLHVGEYAANGAYAPLDVVIESPQLTVDTENPGTLTGSMTFLEAASFDDYHDATERNHH